ncbi:MAG: NrfD/PsrC family molybdoenzyme membrane anchor subunit [Syntrophales bacterium]
MNTGIPAEEKRTFKDIVAFILSELKPTGKLITPFNVISAPLIILGAFLIVYRLVKGMGAVTNLSQEFPWGIWIGFDVMVGVAFAGGAYVLTFVVYILRSDKYHSIIRATVLNGLLAYIFYAGAIFLDLGRWWNITNPLFGNKFGANSVLFLIAWHFLLYMLAEFVEFSPAIAEWLGLRKLRKILGSLTVGAVVVGIALSTLHQAGLGALFMMAKGKVHPLWYTEFIPVLFFVSSIFAGLSMVIFEGTISHKVFSDQISHEDHKSYDDMLIGLSQGCAVSMFVYFFAQFLIFIHGWHWSLLNTPMGYWYLVEMVGLVAIPCYMFFQGARYRNLLLIRTAAILAMIGIIINRLNISIIAFKWWIPFSERYFPSWMEIVITLAIILTEIWVFRWIATRMPVFGKPPAWAEETH